MKKFLINLSAMRITSTLILLCVFLFVAASPLLSKIIINKSMKELVIGPDLEYLQDKDGRLSLGDVMSKGLQSKWKKSDRRKPGFGFTDSVYWVRFTAENNSGEDIKFLLVEDFPLIDHMKLFIPEMNGKFRSIEVGRSRPFFERPYKNRKFIIPLELKAGLKAAYYIRQETTSAMHFMLSLWSPDSFAEEAMIDYQILMIHYGIVATMVLYSLSLFFFIRRREYLYYAFFILFFLIFIMTQNGTAYQFLWPGYPRLASYFIPISLCLTVIFAILFTMDFLNLKKNAYRQARFAISVIFPAVLAITAFCLFAPYKYTVVISTAMTGLLVCYGILIGIQMSIKRVRNAYFYLISWLVFLFGANLYILMTFGMLPSNFINMWSLQVGSALQVLLLSIALADRINMMRKNLVVLTTNLEEKVKERTSDLSAAMEELEATNEQLVITKDALWGEMQLAKKIQTVLLPKKPQIEGYEISAFMATAREVGGDYYDIINAEGMDWVAIGDVSGHGVSAGLVMMMVQTSIQVVLEREPVISPSDLLTLINKTISKNIEKLNESQFMTITVLAAHKGGRFIFSGLHQNLLIFRAGTGRVEVVNSVGIWIGIKNNTQGTFDTNTMELYPGDTLLLYTDGITEAWEKNSIKDNRDPEQQMFGEGRLISVLEKSGRKSPDEIKNDVLKELENYMCKDDVTMVVLRRL